MKKRQADLLAEVLDRVRSTYGSLENPHYGKIGERLAEGPFRSLIAELSKRFTVRDDTDQNDDVCVFLQVDAEGVGLTLQLSLVGPYALLLDASGRALAPAVPKTGWRESTDSSAVIANMIAEHGITLLTSAFLDTPCEMRLWNTNPENVTLYQVLFSDIDLRPWCRE